MNPISGLKNAVILYVEDDAITRKQISLFLKAHCKMLHIASNGQEGFESYKTFNPDIVITDIEMPKLNGLEMARKIRESSLTTQIIIISAYKKPEYLLEAANLQLIQYLVKPLSLEKITAALELSSHFLSRKKVDTKRYFSESRYYDIYTKELIDGDSIIGLSKYERFILERLIRSHPAPVSYESIDAELYDYRGSRNAIKLLIRSLRKKLAIKRCSIRLG